MYSMKIFHITRCLLPRHISKLVGPFHFRVSLPLFLSPNVALAAIAFSSRYYTTLSTRSFADFLLYGHDNKKGTRITGRRACTGVRIRSTAAT